MVNVDINDRMSKLPKVILINRSERVHVLSEAECLTNTGFYRICVIVYIYYTALSTPKVGEPICVVLFSAMSSK